MGLRDTAFECRLAAVQSLSVSVHAQLEGLINLALGDKHSRVRIGAICRLGKLPLRLFTADQKLDLLRSALNDANQTIREAGQSLLLSEWLDSISKMRKNKSEKSTDWEKDSVEYEQNSPVNLDPVYGLGTAAQILLSQLDFEESYEARKSARHILFASFDIIRKRLALENEMLSDFVIALTNDRTKPEIISRSNYKVILNRKLSASKQACYAFFWHSLVKYCSEKARNEPDKLECMHRLTLTLSAMCGVVRKLVSYDQLERMDDSREIQSVLRMKQVTVRETLEILKHLDRDTSGMVEWKNLLESLLSDCSMSKDVTDIIMIDLAEAFYLGKSDDLLSVVCEITAGVVHRAYNPDATLANETVSLPLNMTLRPIEMPELDEITLHFCMQLTHSLLRTGIFNKFNALLRGVYDNVIEKCWSSTLAKVRLWALEAAAMIGMIDETIARGKLPIIVEALSIDEIQVKIGCLDIITDLIIIHGYETVTGWYPATDVEVNGINNLIYYFVDIIKDVAVDPTLCYKTCECVCKILLAEPRGFKDKHWIDTVTSLIMRLCYTSASKSIYVKSCLAQFFPIFCTINRSNQLLLLSGFHSILAEMRASDSEDSLVTKVDIERATLLIINLTRFSVLQETAPGKNDGPVHCVLLSDILKYLTDHPDDGFVRIYCQATALLELDGIPLDEITCMQQGYQSLLDTFVDTVGSRSKSVTELKKLIRRINTAKKTLNSKDIEDSEMDDAVCELPLITALGTPAKGRKTPLGINPPGTSKCRSRRKKIQSTTKKSVRQEAEEILASPYSSRSPSMVDVPPSTRARPKLARLVKKEKTRSSRLFRD